MDTMTARENEKGFALIDALLAVFVLSIGLVAVMDAYVTAAQSLDNAKSVLIANLLAQSKMEQYDALPSSAISNVSCCTNFNAAGEFDATTEGSYGKFTYEMTKASLIAGYVDQLTLTVHYKTFGKDRTMTYVMLKGKK